MATTEEREYEERLRREVVLAATPVVAGVPTEGIRVSWGGVWSGFLLGIGTLMLLSTLGIAVGLSVVDLEPGQPQGQPLGIAALWAGISLLVSLFIGGMVAARMGMVFDRPTGGMEGALVWVLAMLGLLYLAASGLSLGASAFLGMAPAVVRSGPDLTALTGNDPSRIIATLDDPRSAEALATTSGMTPDQARVELARIRALVEANRADPARAAAEARRALAELAGRATAWAGARAEPYATTTGWMAFGLMVLSLLAAVLGGTAGARRAAARAVE
jgi:hypothetical protein